MRYGAARAIRSVDGRLSKVAKQPPLASGGRARSVRKHLVFCR